MLICTLTQTHNHASVPPPSFLQAGCPSRHPTNSIKAHQLTHTQNATLTWNYLYRWNERHFCYWVNVKYLPQHLYASVTIHIAYQTRLTKRHVHVVGSNKVSCGDMIWPPPMADWRGVQPYSVRERRTNGQIVALLNTPQYRAGT